MQSVTVKGVADASPNDVQSVLDPRSIIDYAGNYDVVSVEPIDGRQLVKVRKTSSKTADIEAVFEFMEQEIGYTYTQREDVGPYRKMRTEIIVERTENYDAETLITVHSEFTFGGPLRLLIDPVAAKYRQRELEQLISNLVTRVEDGTVEV